MPVQFSVAAHEEALRRRQERHGGRWRDARQLLGAHADTKSVDDDMGWDVMGWDGMGGHGAWTGMLGG
ncbi:hypothetical protein O9K51_09204 [Purpureocillium lavendulum]|uniref:Uncharacterized protein n=1 Tax=Purpureocillium lavendulum TaxID=1247861 RepID=A0AB34FHB6_9HYPO|nr:hypothetical protein O9K51_09204 [Purpureocillium lavendulum]